MQDYFYMNESLHYGDASGFSVGNISMHLQSLAM